LTALWGASQLADAAEARPAFDGVWQIAVPVTLLKTVDGRWPPLLPAARKLYVSRIRLHRDGHASQYDGAFTCKPIGDPRTMYDGLPFDIIQGENAIVFGYTWNRMLRFVHMKNQQGEVPGPTYYGTWVGKWEADTLVLEGAGFNKSTLLDAAGMPHGEELHLVQRLTLKHGGNQLEVRTHIEDMSTFSAPWDTLQTYRRLPGAVITEDICQQRPR
jgi:hypothetical protein